MFETFKGFGAVFYKETLHVRRDFGTLFFSLVIPLLQMVVLGFAIDTNIRQINTVVYNADGRRESREAQLSIHRKGFGTRTACRRVRGERARKRLATPVITREGTTPYRPMGRTHEWMRQRDSY